MLWAGLYFFCLLAAYYALRPMRDAFGAENPYELHWLFTGTMVATFVAQPLFGRLVSRRGRAAFLPIAYRFLIANALVFGLLLGTLEGEALRWAQRAFFVWLSVFNVFGVSIFWGFLADILGPERAKRLYGPIAVGGTLGAINGSVLAGHGLELLEAGARSVGWTDLAQAPFLLPLLSAVFLEVAVHAARRVERVPLVSDATDPADAEEPLGGGATDGFREVVRSPYLGGIAGYVLLFVLVSTMLYFITGVQTSEAFADEMERSAFYARVDLWVNVLTLVFQVLLTSQVLRRLGVGVALAAVPAVGLVGFSMVASDPGLTALAILFVARRSFEFGFSKPARESLFAVVRREEKYKAKTVIDAFVYRVGDAAVMWIQAGLTALGVGITALAWGMVPVCAGSLILALWLGRSHGRRSHRGRQRASLGA